MEVHGDRRLVPVNKTRVILVAHTKVKRNSPSLALRRRAHEFDLRAQRQLRRALKLLDLPHLCLRGRLVSDWPYLVGIWVIGHGLRVTTHQRLLRGFVLCRPARQLARRAARVLRNRYANLDVRRELLIGEARPDLDVHLYARPPELFDQRHELER